MTIESARLIIQQIEWWVKLCAIFDVRSVEAKNRVLAFDYQNLIKFKSLRCTKNFSNNLGTHLFFSLFFFWSQVYSTIIYKRKSWCFYARYTSRSSIKSYEFIVKNINLWENGKLLKVLLTQLNLVWWDNPTLLYLGRWHWYSLHVCVIYLPYENYCKTGKNVTSTITFPHQTSHCYFFFIIIVEKLSKE